MYSNCKQHWRLRKCVSRNLGSLARCMVCWHTGTSHSTQEDLGVLGYLSFRDDQGAQEDLLNLWTLVVLFWILLEDLEDQAALEVPGSRHPFHPSLLLSLVPQEAPASLACPGSPVALRALVLLSPRHCQVALEDPEGPAGCGWSGNHLESDSASD